MFILLLASLMLPYYANADMVLRVQVASTAKIYSQPDYKAEVVETVPIGTVLFASTQKQIGTTGMGVFYKVKTAGGKTGFVSDSDLLNPGQERLKPLRVPRKPDLGLRASIGPSLAALDYSEKINGEREHGNQLFFGVRRIGSSRRLNQLRSDIGLIVSPVPPTFLGGLGAVGSAKGFIALLDVLALWPFYESRSYSLGVEAGPMLAFAKYSGKIASGPIDKSDFRPGGILGLSFGYNFSGGILRFDARSYIESTIYYGAMASFQFKL